MDIKISNCGISEFENWITYEICFITDIIIIFIFSLILCTCKIIVGSSLKCNLILNFYTIDNKIKIISLDIAFHRCNDMILFIIKRILNLFEFRFNDRITFSWEWCNNLGGLFEYFENRIIFVYFKLSQRLLIA
jgi:hypothetical protein